MKTNFGKSFRLAAALLCLAILSLAMGIAASSVEFTDNASIGTPYRTAVGSMADKGILNGFPDGCFLPDGTLTREQAAKIVTYMVLGLEVNRLTCDEAPFMDVAADRWSAPCISWCADRQILLGYGNGRFGPEERLTGDQFAKMLLCSMELAREGNYVGLGDGWFTAVREDARAAGLYEGDESMATGLPINREQAALMAWNAIRAAEAGFTPTVPEPPKPVSPEPVFPEPVFPEPEVQPGTEPEIPPADPVKPDPVKPDPADNEPDHDRDTETPGIDMDPYPEVPKPTNPEPTDPEPADPEPTNPEPTDPGDIVLPEVP